MKTISVALLALGTAAFAASPAAEKPPKMETRPVARLEPQPLTDEDRRCDLRPRVVAELVHGLQEQPVAGGVMGNGNQVEVFSSPETGTWSVVISLPSGVSSVGMAGESFRVLPDRVAKRG